MEKDGDIKAMPQMLSADAVATVFGSILGTSTTTSYIESAAGVAEGGRTGLTAITTGILFLLAAFFTPVIGSVQAYATAPALIIVGIFMMRGIGQINFYDFEEGVPAFLTLILMPLTYSIAQGLVFGFISYALIKLLVGKVKELDPVLMVIAALCVVSLLI
jgi:AGZA family xanthine/uracil permease-like MFS transporter